MQIAKDKNKYYLTVLLVHPKIFESMILRTNLMYPRSRVDVGLRIPSFLPQAPSSFVIFFFPYLLTQADEIVYTEMHSIYWTALAIWMIC